MKLKLTLALVALAGLAAALALAGPTQAGDGNHGSTTTGATSTGSSTGTTTTGKKDDDGGKHHGNGSSTCQRVELRGTNGSGSVAFTVTQASHGGSGLGGKQVTLTVPAGSAVGATACTDAAGMLTLRSLVVRPPAATPTTTTTTTTSNTTKAPHKHHNSHH